MSQGTERESNMTALHFALSNFTATEIITLVFVGLFAIMATLIIITDR